MTPALENRPSPKHAPSCRQRGMGGSGARFSNLGRAGIFVRVRLQSAGRMDARKPRRLNRAAGPEVPKPAYTFSTPSSSLVPRPPGHCPHDPMGIEGDLAKAISGCPINCAFTVMHWSPKI